MAGRDFQFLSNLHSATTLLADVGEEAGKTSKKFEEFGKKTLKLAGYMRTFSEAMKINMTLSKRFINLYEKDTKVLASFQESVYKGAHALRTANGGFKTIAKSQEAYKKQIDEMRKGSLFTTQQMTNMYGSIVNSMKGIRTTNAVGEVAKLGKAFVELEGDVEKGISSLESVMDLLNKYKSMQEIGERARKGAMTSDDSLRLKYMLHTERATLEQVRKFEEVNKQAKYSSTSGILDVGRKDSLGLKESEKLFADADLFISASEAVKSFAEEARKAADAISKNAQRHSEMWGKYSALGTAVGGAAMGLGLVGAASLGFSKLGGKDSGKSGGGILSRLGSGLGAAGGDVRGVKVWVSNMPGTGLTSAFNAAGSGTGVKEVAAATATRGLLSKVVGFGGKLLKFGAILGPLIAGFKEYGEEENKGLSTGNKIGAALIKGSITALGAIAGGVITAGNPLGAIAGGVGGAALGEKATDLLYGGARKGKEEEKGINNLVIAKEKELDIVEEQIDIYGELGKANQEVNSSFVIYQDSAKSMKQFADSLGEVIGTAHLGAAALRQYGEEQINVASSYKPLIENYKKDVENAKDEDTKIMARAALRKLEAEQMEARISGVKALSESVTKVTDEEMKMAFANTAYSKSEKDLHEIKRMGMGVSYDDTVRNIQALAVEVSVSKQAYRNKLKLANEWKNDPFKYEQYMTEATQLRAESIKKETELYSEAKGMREGYLDAFRSEMSATGGYAELFPTRDSGIQNFAKSLALGGTNVAGVDTPGKYTTSGVKFDKEGQERVADALLDTKSFIIGQSDLQGVLMEQGIGINVEQLDVGKEQLQTQKALLQATERASGIRPNASAGGVISATGAVAGSSTGAGAGARVTGSVAAAGSVAAGSSTKQTLEEAFYSGKINIDEYRNKRLERARLAAQYSGESKRNPFGEGTPKMDVYDKLKKEKNYREDRRFQERMNDWALKEVGGKIAREQYDKASITSRTETTEKWKDYKEEESRKQLERIAVAVEKAVAGTTGGIYGS